MIRVREAIEAAGFPCIDGSRIPGGKDWRYVHLHLLHLLEPLDLVGDCAGVVAEGKSFIQH